VIRKTIIYLPTPPSGGKRSALPIARKKRHA